MSLLTIVLIWIVLAVLLTLWWHESERRAAGQPPDGEVESSAEVDGKISAEVENE